MTTKYEHDWPPTMRPRRRRPRIETMEILPPRQPEHHVRVTITTEHRRHNMLPQRLVIVAAMLILAMILLRSPFGLLMLAVLVPPTFWIAVGVTIAALV